MSKFKPHVISENCSVQCLFDGLPCTRFDFALKIPVCKKRVFVCSRSREYFEVFFSD